MVINDHICAQIVQILVLSFSSKFDLALVSIAKTASKKIGSLIHSLKFLSSEIALYGHKSFIQTFL